MSNESYLIRRGELEQYFDRTAVEAWARLTSDAPVSRVRATVRAGRDRMRATLLGWLPEDLRGRRVLDAGCGTGAVAIALAERGAEVLAVDLSPTLLDLARERLAPRIRGLALEFRAGDMLDASLGRFDHVVAMDSLIHYPSADLVGALAVLASRTRESIVCTFAPRTAALAAMHAVGRWFPRADRAPAIEPIREAALRAGVAAHPGLAGWTAPRTSLVASGFYRSQAIEFCRRSS